jgi:hypothetical protein
MTGWPEEARVEMAEWIEDLRRRKDLRHQKRDARSRIITNRSQGWVSVPVRRLADYPGPKCTHSVRDFLPLEQIEKMPTLSATWDEELARLLEDAWDQDHGVAEADSSAGFANCLADDWDWERIDAAARCRVGHRFPGRKHASVVAIVIGAGHDLEDAFFQVHPRASCAAVAILWKSWQIQQHIARFCFRLVKSETARALVGGDEPAGEVERARWFVLDQLAALAVMHNDTGCKVANSADQLPSHPAPGVSPRVRFRGKNDELENIRRLVRQMRSERASHREICERLGTHPRPLHALWKNLPWPQAYKQYPRSVAKWLSSCK